MHLLIMQIQKILFLVLLAEMIVKILPRNVYGRV